MASQQPTTKRLSDEDAQRLRTEIELKGPRRAFLALQWVETLTMATRELDENPDHAKWPWVSEFWIKLNGVLEELVPWYRGIHELVESTEDVPAKGSTLWRAEAVHLAVEAIRNSLTEDEVILANYVRQICAHVFQDAYYLRGNMNRPRLAETLWIEALGRELPRQELRQRGERLLEGYGTDMRAAGVAFARKTARATLALLQALRELRGRD